MLFLTIIVSAYGMLPANMIFPKPVADGVFKVLSTMSIPASFVRSM